MWTENSKIDNDKPDWLFCIFYFHQCILISYFKVMPWVSNNSRINERWNWTEMNLFNKKKINFWDKFTSLTDTIMAVHGIVCKFFLGGYVKDSFWRIKVSDMNTLLDG